MDKFDKIQQLHRLFAHSRFPIPINTIAEALECSKKTAKTSLDLLRDRLNAPIVYDEKTRGWHYSGSADNFELPGLWLTAEELHSLAVILNILSTMDEGLLGKEIEVVNQQLEKLLNAHKLSTADFTRSIKYVATNKRAVTSRHFAIIVDALLHKTQLLITYTDYSGNTTQRTISPQQLIHYQENWYLDAWCHKREALRSFMLPRIKKVLKSNAPSDFIAKEVLQEHYQTSYGIFAGKPKYTAVLSFRAQVAVEAASVRWHPEQLSEWNGDEFQITVPYNDDRELIRDILKYGKNIEVMKPDVLRSKIKNVAAGMLELYG